MHDSQVTRPSLLIRLRDNQDHEAWKQFIDVYAPMVQSFALRKGLQSADASDVTQEVMRIVASHMQDFQYDPTKGKFRGWLLTTTRNQVVNYAKRFGKLRGSGRSDVQEILLSQPEDTDDDAEWGRDYQKSLFAYACEKIQNEFTENTWQVFQMSTEQSKNPAEIACELGMSVGAVYVAKSRVIARLREFVATMGEEDFLISDEAK